MLVKDVSHLDRGGAADRTQLREILHPDRDPAELRYSLAHAMLAPGESSLRHRLTSAEVYYILYGSALMHVGEDAQQVHAGHAVYVPKGSVQWIENTGTIDLAFLCIVDPPWSSDGEEILD
jgi:mannose-6-phosphate isomerase-like protein (cupin superfamily)